jgi:hypothetical protein
MGIFDWLKRGRDALKSLENSVHTRPGKLAYDLAVEISAAKDLRRWKELMDVYYKTTDPKAKVEVLNIARLLAKTMGVRKWRVEVKTKMDELQRHGYL